MGLSLYQAGRFIVLAFISNYAFQGIFALCLSKCFFLDFSLRKLDVLQGTADEISATTGNKVNTSIFSFKLWNLDV